jgi:N-acetyl-1-D-myo-inositol-2-amino-2-deoxy-alpha-D-glucopyranoside deacetylase
MMKRSILAIYAHPDDETFGTGGTLAHYARQGSQVTLVCATRGEAGEISDPELASPETLGQVREMELDCAAHKMGIEEVFFLNYRDSGMAGTAENDDPRAFVNAPAEEVVGRLVALIRRLRPQIVITFEPHGGYGHPDHITIHHHTLTAFHAAADPERYPLAGDPWQAERLFYSVIPRSLFDQLRQWLAEAGEDTADLDQFEADGSGWPDDQIHVVMDISALVEAKWQALECHATQFGPDNLFRRVPEEKAKAAISQEHFAQAWPPPPADLQRNDLFAGL